MLPSLRERLWELRDHARRAGDWHSFRTLEAMPNQLVTLQLRIHDQTIPVTLRGGTHDVVRASLILREESEYQLADDIRNLDPHVILDLGANIGLAALYFAARYPHARIWSVEPLPENLALLEQNVAYFGGRITVLPCGVGETAGSFCYFASDDPLNFGGGTFARELGDESRTWQLPVRTLEELVRTEHIPQPDVIKLDVEGYEGPILRGAPSDLIAQTRVIIGELHGLDDWRILDKLSVTHRIGITKRWNRAHSAFRAVRKLD